MNMYNMLFGTNKSADVILLCLGLTEGDCGRFRDCYIDGETIVIHTRNGGGNREYYEDDIEFLRSHPNYLRDEDDSFDCTYADFYFSFPEEFKDLLVSIDQGTPPAEKWKALFEALDSKKDLGEA